MAASVSAIVETANSPGSATGAVPTRLLVITDTPILGAGGSERFLRNLLARLDPQRYKVCVVQLSKELPVKQRVQTDLGEHVDLRYQPVGPIYGLAGLRAIRHMRALVRGGGYDIVQSQHEKSDLINALLPRGPAHVWRISNRRDMGFQKSSLLRSMFRLLNFRFDRVVAPSRAILGALRRDESIPTARMLCIQNGVDAEKFQPAGAPQRRIWRETFGFGDREILFGCVAAFRPVKRHADLLKAFARLHGEVPDARLLLIGEGPLRAQVESQIAELKLGDVVRLLGDRPNVEHILPALDVFVLTSNSEGMSNAILEAMACGLPIIATAVGGNPDLVAHERSGLLVPRAAIGDLSVALKRLATDALLRQRCGAASRARIEREFSLDSMTAQFDALYQSLRARHAR